MYLLCRILLGVLISYLLKTVTPASLMAFKTKKIECISNKDFIENSTCNLVAVNWHESYIDADTYLIKPVNNVMVEVKFYRKDNTNQFKPFMFPFNFNLCKNDQKHLLIPYSNMVVEHLRAYTNINHSCPYEGHIFARKLFSDDKLFPDFPVGNYKFSIKFWENSVRFGEIIFYVEAEERRLSKRRGQKIV